MLQQLKDLYIVTTMLDLLLLQQLIYQKVKFKQYYCEKIYVDLYKGVLNHLCITLYMIRIQSWTFL